MGSWDDVLNAYAKPHHYDEAERGGSAKGGDSTMYGNNSPAFQRGFAEQTEMQKDYDVPRGLRPFGVGEAFGFLNQHASG